MNLKIKDFIALTVLLSCYVIIIITFILMYNPEHSIMITSNEYYEYYLEVFLLIITAPFVISFITKTLIRINNYEYYIDMETKKLSKVKYDK